MGNIRIPFEAGACYHIYNHAVGDENIFREDDNYEFFLRKMSSRIIPFAEILSYCLMGNHFHLVMRIKTHEELITLWKSKIQEKLKKKKDQSPVHFKNELLDEIIINEFAKLFNAYVQAYNKKYSRRGGLLKQSFQRKRIDSSEYLLKLICYVHNNPVESGFTSSPNKWKYSSFNAVLSDKKTNIQRDEVIEMFGGKENFVYMHNRNMGFDIEI